MNGKNGLVIKILNEIKSLPTDFGPKPTGEVELTDGIEKSTKSMRFNQIFINYLIEKTGEKNSIKWIGQEVPIKVKTIKGNLSIVPKESKD